jgi:AmiR/NasT family two-component response regulator
VTTNENIGDARWRASLWREMATIERAKGALMERHEVDSRAAAALLALCAEQDGIEISEAAQRLS